MYHHSKILAATAAVSVFSFATVLSVAADGFRSIDGSGNNIANPDWGQTDTQLLRLTTPATGNGMDTANS